MRSSYLYVDKRSRNLDDLDASGQPVFTQRRSPLARISHDSKSRIKLIDLLWEPAVWVAATLFSTHFPLSRHAHSWDSLKTHIQGVLCPRLMSTSVCQGLVKSPVCLWVCALHVSDVWVNSEGGRLLSLFRSAGHFSLLSYFSFCVSWQGVCVVRVYAGIWSDGYCSRWLFQHLALFLVKLWSLAVALSFFLFFFYCSYFCLCHAIPFLSPFSCPSPPIFSFYFSTPKSQFMLQLIAFVSGNTTHPRNTPTVLKHQQVEPSASIWCAGCAHCGMSQQGPCGLDSAPKAHWSNALSHFHTLPLWAVHIIPDSLTVVRQIHTSIHSGWGAVTVGLAALLGPI